MSSLILSRGVKVNEGQSREASPCSLQSAVLSGLGGYTIHFLKTNARDVNFYIQIKLIHVFINYIK